MFLLQMQMHLDFLVQQKLHIVLTPQIGEIRHLLKEKVVFCMPCNRLFF
jgi:hypothetical protein